MTHIILYLRTLLGFEPIIGWHTWGTEDEQAKKVLLETYRGWGIYYYYGKVFRHYNVSSACTSSMTSYQYDRAEYIGDGVYIGAFKDSYCKGKIALESYWIRTSYDGVDARFEDRFVNPTERVKAKFDKMVLCLKHEIDEHIRNKELQDIKDKLKREKEEKHRIELEQAINQPLRSR